MFADLDALHEAFIAGSPRALARAITLAESGRGSELVRRVFSRSGRAASVGITGPPGVGKSTLCSSFVRTLRAEGKTVGVISVDPSSPFSKGALLGDRIRLTEHFTDGDVFIRSMASRGHLGGVAGATADAVLFMDAFGKDVVVVETVGVGQSEIEIAHLADTTVVALQPGSGDSIQVLKAGILEVADVFVVNKSDHPMALQLQREIRTMMEMLNFRGWTPALVATQALDGAGIDAMWAAIQAHRQYLESSGQLAVKRREAFAYQVRQLALGRLERRLDRELGAPRNAAPRAPGGSEDPYAAAARVLRDLGLDGDDGEWPDVPAPAPRSTVRGL